VFEQSGVALPCSSRSLAINTLIHAALCQVAEGFLTERLDTIVENFYRYDPSYKASDDFTAYETFVNCLDSSVWFTDDYLQWEFDRWRDERV
jgi:hypothetical protein